MEEVEGVGAWREEEEEEQQVSRVEEEVGEWVGRRRVEEEASGDDGAVDEEEEVEEGGGGEESVRFRLLPSSPFRWFRCRIFFFSCSSSSPWVFLLLFFFPFLRMGGRGRFSTPASFVSPYRLSFRSSSRTTFRKLFVSDPSGTNKSHDIKHTHTHTHTETLTSASSMGDEKISIRLGNRCGPADRTGELERGGGQKQQLSHSCLCFFRPPLRM